MSIELKSIFPALPKTTRGTPLVINGDPKGENILYTNGINVIIRSIENTGKSDVYSEHSYATHVAKYSPSRNYIASGDLTGKVRIWDTINKEHILKNEYQPMGGAVKDLAWSSDNQRMVVAGIGKEKFGHVFSADTGTSVGDISGQVKSINSCDFKPQRPFRIVTASEDFSVAFYEGPPFKFKHTIRCHKNFVNAVRYAPNGEVFVTGGADGRAFVCNGKTGQVGDPERDWDGQLGNPAHKGGIYALSFGADSKRVLTASADKTCKIFDVTDGTELQVFQMEEQQVSCLWQSPSLQQAKGASGEEHLISVSVSGFINFLDPENPSQPKRIIKGHNKPITAMTVSEDRSRFYTAGTDGFICEWDPSTAENDMFSGKPHTNQIESMKLVDGRIISVSIDDTFMVSDVANKSYGVSVKLPSQPRCVDAVAGGLAVVACYQHIVMCRGDQIVFSQSSDELTCVAVHPEGKEVAVGGPKPDAQIYSITGDTLTESRKLTQREEIVALAYSPDGSYLAVTDLSRSTKVYKLPSFELLTKDGWTFHTGRVKSLDWSPNSQYLASGGLDNSIYVYDVQDVRSVKKMKQAHPKGSITNVRWLANDTLVSVSNDSNTKIWNISEDQAKKI